MKTIATACMSACLFFALPAHAKIEKSSFGETPDHRKVDLYTLTNTHGLVARIDLAPEMPPFMGRVCSGYAPQWGVLQTRSV